MYHILDAQTKAPRMKHVEEMSANVQAETPSSEAAGRSDGVSRPVIGSGPIGTASVLV